ncbi:MAG: threonylcarbamoyl-AMP synthase [Chloroflexi bacterium]|nr:MAG: threonylcarbamoyl-AMP synthase [Chloroflexota bacterium]
MTLTGITQLLKSSEPTDLTKAAEYLRQGQLVVFPTDTVYGVGVSAFNPAAIDQLYAMKERPLSKGIPILISHTTALSRIVTHIPLEAMPLIHQFWPGPLTLILPRHPDLPENISPNKNVAVRVPDHPVARTLISAAGGAVATSSANISGQPPAQTAEDALKQLEGRVAAILDDGRSPGALPSTILDLTTPKPKILRHGPVSAQTLSQFIDLEL